MVTMTEVARAADVSVSTVSHVVNGTRLVAPRTRERVLRAMRVLGYQHHPIARSLSAGTNQTIGLALTAASNPYWVELIQGIDGEATRAGLNLIIVDTRDDARHESAAVANLLAHHIEGLVIAPADGWRDLTLPLLRDRPVPYVVVDRIDPELRVDQVGVENEASTAAVVDHLISVGHHRIGLVAGIPGLSTSAERLRGYHLAHRTHPPTTRRTTQLKTGRRGINHRRSSRPHHQQAVADHARTGQALNYSTATMRPKTQLVAEAAAAGCSPKHTPPEVRWRR